MHDTDVEGIGDYSLHLLQCKWRFCIVRVRWSRSGRLQAVALRAAWFVCSLSLLHSRTK
jgi:hypothetical protein